MHDKSPTTPSGRKATQPEQNKHSIIGDRLEPDCDQLAAFVTVMLRHAGSDGYVSLRLFDDRGKVFNITTVPLEQGMKGVITAAQHLASVAAHARRGVVFSPCVCVFGNAKHAREQDMLRGLELSVECDQQPQAARQRLEELLGPATVVVASGGEWTNPETDEVEPKLHLHFRLSKAAADKTALVNLKTARSLATALAGGDPSNVPLVHPIRWPGTVHRKGAPKLCRIITIDAAREIDLTKALKILTSAAKKQANQIGNGAFKGNGSSAKSEPAPSGNKSPNQKLNDLALANLALWVPEIFPTAKPYHGNGFRVSSADLGRDNVEDLSLVPEGIKDFGVHDLDDPRDGKRTPIDIVMEHVFEVPVEQIARRDPSVAFQRASDWLRERLKDVEDDDSETVFENLEDIDKDQAGGRHNKAKAKAKTKAKAKAKTKAKAKAKCETFTARTLGGMTFPPIKYVVPDIIVEGLTLLAGKPKIGKSWLFLEVAIAVADNDIALGEIRCEQGDVLYCALEDNMRRLQSRMEILLGAPDPEQWPARLHFRCQLPRLAEGGIKEIEDWIKAANHPRLVIIDTLAMVRNPKTRDQTTYEADYDSVKALRDLANTYNIAIVVVTHLRKATADDPFDTVSGTLGLTGATDSILVLYYEAAGVVLKGKGRDLLEFEKALSFDKGAARWVIKGDAADVRRSTERSMILAALDEAAAADAGLLGPRQIAEATGMKAVNIRALLSKLINEGVIERVGYGRYRRREAAEAEPKKFHRAENSTRAAPKL